MKIQAKTGHGKLIETISEIFIRSRNELARTINSGIVNTYWAIGKHIVEYEQKGRERAGYGSEMMKSLSRELSSKLGKGFSRSNLQNMRLLYMSYPKSQTLSGKLGWSHYCLLLAVSSKEARRFYESETLNSSWSVRELERQIDSSLFERLALSKDKKGIIGLAKKGHIIETAADIVKDPYVLEFLGIPESEKLSEIRLESKIIGHLKTFMLELGRGFLFVGRQYRITMNSEHYHVDLVFYNVHLKCYVLIDLKTRKFRHEDAGQMNFYLNYFKNEVNTETDSPPIGIILCADKNKVFVDYVLGGLSNRIFASKYRLSLPTPKELAEEVKKDAILGDKNDK